MDQTIRAYGRSRQVLRALHRHGPMTWRALHQIVEPPIKAGRLASTIGRLKAKGWVVNRGSDFPSLQINQRGHYWVEIASEIGVTQDTLDQSWARFFDIVTEDQAAVWAERLKRLLPTADVLRNHEVAADPALRTRFFRDVKGRSVGPDLLLRVPTERADDPIHVAVRIDRPNHRHERQMSTFRNDAADTGLDDVLYLTRAEDRIRQVGEISGSKSLRDAVNERESGPFFMMFGDVTDIQRGLDPRVLSTDRKVLQLTAWVQLLRRVKTGL